jgi:hypothetical protein
LDVAPLALVPPPRLLVAIVVAMMGAARDGEAVFSNITHHDDDRRHGDCDGHFRRGRLRRSGAAEAAGARESRAAP